MRTHGRECLHPAVLWRGHCKASNSLVFVPVEDPVLFGEYFFQLRRQLKANINHPVQITKAGFIVNINYFRINQCRHFIIGTGFFP